jgi:K(+)-stimulated pyrophosphate-energized sodium pump
VLAAAIQQLTGYFTETGRRPVDDVAKSALTGPATVILTGLSVGFESAVYSALLIGAAVVFLFSGLAINAVSRAAGAVIYEVRRQFRDHPGIMEGTEKPEYGKVVDIVTRDSLRELSTPGLLAMLTPIAVGFGLGVGALGTFLAGTIATGTLMAVFLANSGGAWDNAKKYVEDGNLGGKNSPAHAATVIGDTVGDPFKDTAGPAINPLLKVMNLVALLIAPAVVALTLDGRTTLRVGIALVALAIVVGSVIVSRRREGPGEEIIDAIADEVEADSDAEARQRKLDVYSVMPGVGAAGEIGDSPAAEGGSVVTTVDPGATADPEATAVPGATAEPAAPVDPVPADGPDAPRG